MTNDLNHHASAQMAFMQALRRHRLDLVEALRNRTMAIDIDAPVRTLVRLARVLPDKPGLAEFETAMRAPLAAYIDATPREARSVMLADAQFLLDHFDRFTEVPLTANPVKRVVSWARRKLRGAAKEPGDVD